MKNHIHEKTGKVFPRGAKPTPKHILDAAKKFLRPSVRAEPPFFFIFPKKLSMWGNGPDPNWPNPDGDGDCVSAEEAFNKACNGIFIEDATLYKWCVANGTLNGANLQPVIQQMQSAGFSQDGNIYGDGSALSVDYTNATTMQAAIYQAGQQGGCVKFGLAADELPQGAGNQNGWFLPTDSPDTNEDHCMGCCGYGTAQQFCDAMNQAFPGLNLTVPAGIDPTMQGYAIYTWSTIGFASVQAFVNMTGEAWLRNPSSVNTGTGTPDSVAVYVTGAPTPPTPPVPPTPPTPPAPPEPPTPGVTLLSSITLTWADGTTQTLAATPNPTPAGGIPPVLIPILKMLCALLPPGDKPCK